MNLIVCTECSRCGSPVTDSLESEIEQHEKVEISTEMDVSYAAILIGTLSCGMLRLKKAHMMAYDMQLKDFTTMYDEEAISKMV
ncbi:MAG: hypothetical protein WCF06_14480 [Nitrososphaeraceae archaeon]